MSIYDNPSFYISIFSSVCFAASEILPFVPIKGNGIIHSILVCLSFFDKEKHDATVTDEKHDATVTDEKPAVASKKASPDYNDMLDSKAGNV